MLMSVCIFSFTEAVPSRRPPAQTNARPAAGRAARGSTKPVCKTEPEMENQTGEPPVILRGNVACVERWKRAVDAFGKLTVAA